MSPSFRWDGGQRLSSSLAGSAPASADFSFHSFSRQFDVIIRSNFANAFVSTQFQRDMSSCGGSMLQELAKTRRWLCNGNQTRCLLKHIAWKGPSSAPAQVMALWCCLALALPELSPAQRTACQERRVLAVRILHPTPSQARSPGAS